VSLGEPRWVPRIAVETFHLDQIREHGGLHGLRDQHALESALARPRHRWHYQPDSDLHDLAAAYAFGLATNHPFHDGNKRTAFLTAVVFLGLNGQRFEAPEDEVVKKIVALAAGQLDEAPLAAWFRDRAHAE
jgi:death-on-curing protein